MHVPDGFLTNRIALSLDALSAASVLYAARCAKLEVSARAIPVMGVLSAFIFGAQLLNFPVMGGTSGHLIGGALLGIVLGPMAGFLTMATVIIAQALFLQDGGLVALGANLFNIGAVSSFVGFLIYRITGAPVRPGKYLAVAGFFAGWVSVVASAAACGIELGLSGAVSLRIGLPVMIGYHSVIGIIEGLLTAAILSLLARVRPDLLKRDFGAIHGLADWAGGIVLVASPLAILALAGASSLPDPLQALLVAPPVSSEALIAPARYTDLHLYLLYFSGLVACVAGFVIVRMVRIRRGRP